MNEFDFRLRGVDWPAAGDRLLAVRRAVFVEEQGVPEALEHDAHDAVSYHVLAEDRQGQPIGTGRLLPDGHIGRLAVLPLWRGRGVGSAMLEHLIGEAARRGLREVVLNAQIQALMFYLRAGFEISSDEFIEAGILHRHMRKPLHNG